MCAPTSLIVSLVQCIAFVHFAIHDSHYFKYIYIEWDKYTPIGRCHNAPKTSLSILLLTHTPSRSLRTSANFRIGGAQRLFTYLEFDDSHFDFVCDAARIVAINSLFNEQTHARIHATLWRCQSPIDTNYLVHILLFVCAAYGMECET